MKCSKVYIGKMGRCIHEQIKEHDRDIQLSWTQTSATLEQLTATFMRLKTWQLSNTEAQGSLLVWSLLFPSFCTLQDKKTQNKIIGIAGRLKHKQKGEKQQIECKVR